MLVMMKVVRALNFLYGLELMSRTSPHSLTRTHTQQQQQQKHKKKTYIQPTNHSTQFAFFITFGWNTTIQKTETFLRPLIT